MTSQLKSLVYKPPHQYFNVKKVQNSGSIMFILDLRRMFTLNTIFVCDNGNVALAIACYWFNEYNEKAMYFLNLFEKNELKKLEVYIVPDGFIQDEKNWNIFQTINVDCVKSSVF